MAIDRFSGPHRFLSNFYPCHIRYEGIVYPSTEHAFQAAKTMNDLERRVISKMKSSSEAKRAGRRVSLRSDWDRVRLGIMEELNRQKYAYSDMKKLLLSTGDEELIEGNTWNDTFWGVCNGKGKNHLGRILMRIREDLKAEP